MPVGDLQYRVGQHDGPDDEMASSENVHRALSAQSCTERILPTYLETYLATSLNKHVAYTTQELDSHSIDFDGSRSTSPGLSETYSDYSECERLWLEVERFRMMYSGKQSDECAIFSDDGSINALNSSRNIVFGSISDRICEIVPKEACQRISEQDCEVTSTSSCHEE